MISRKTSRRKRIQTNTSKEQLKSSDNQTRLVRRLMSKYCWTHGACDYKGRDCMKRVLGYKVEATKKNMLGGFKVYYS